MLTAAAGEVGGGGAGGGAGGGVGGAGGGRVGGVLLRQEIALEPSPQRSLLQATSQEFLARK